MKYIVAVYEQDRNYGGPEEGGWWYDSGSLTRIVTAVKSREHANLISRRFNRLLEHRRKTLGYRHYGAPISSVNYAGGHFAAEVYEHYAPLHYPENRPHYE